MPLNFFHLRSHMLPGAFLLGGVTLALAQQPAPPPANSPLMQRMSAFLDVPNGAWTPQEITTMNRLRAAALTDPYAMNELRHLTDNIGPRLSGSPQAQQAVEFVAAEMRSLGAEVTLEKTSVPHWVRGAETGELVAWPGMAPATTQKIVLTALGSSVATPADGLTAEVIVVNSFNDLKALSPDAVKGKILLFNEKFDKRLAAQGYGFEAYGQAVVYRMTAPVVGAAHGAVAVLVRSVGGADFRLPHTGMTMYDPQSDQRFPPPPSPPKTPICSSDLTSQGPVSMHLTLTPQTLPDAPATTSSPTGKAPSTPSRSSSSPAISIPGTSAPAPSTTARASSSPCRPFTCCQQLGIHPKRTVRFIAWMAEEEGSQGAQTYAQEHAADIANHIGAIETDSEPAIPPASTSPASRRSKPVAASRRPDAQPIGASELVATPETGEDIATSPPKASPASPRSRTAASTSTTTTPPPTPSTRSIPENSTKTPR